MGVVHKSKEEKRAPPLQTKKEENERSQDRGKKLEGVRPGVKKRKKSHITLRIGKTEIKGIEFQGSRKRRMEQKKAVEYYSEKGGRVRILHC